MGTATYPVGVRGTRGEQLSLSTSLASLGIPPGYYQTRLYVPSTDFRFHINPAILEARFYDASAAAGSRFVAVHANLVDRDTATGTGTSMDSATTSDYLYLCFAEPVGGVRITIGNANANAATISGQYSKNDKTWATWTLGTDGTASGGATLAVTGSATFTLPTDWGYMTLLDLAITDADRPPGGGFWVRLTWSAALDASTSITEAWTLNKDTTTRLYAYLGMEYPISFDRRAVGAIEAVLAAGTDTMDISWVR